MSSVISDISGRNPHDLHLDQAEDAGFPKFSRKMPILECRVRQRQWSWGFGGQSTERVSCILAEHPAIDTIGRLW